MGLSLDEFECLEVAYDAVFQSLEIKYNNRAEAKEYVSREETREPFKYLFLPKMGLLGSQASTIKNLRTPFSTLLC